MLSEQSQKWFPTHVQVTVLEARALAPKGKSGANDAYALIQLGKEKYSTSVAEKSLSPVWMEEASFELPGLLVRGAANKYLLQLVVMHRSLVGLDRFLGQVAVSLNDVFEDKERRKTEWFKLESKPGKKPKERGEIKVNIQFMRNNMTASMFDLSMKDKTRSPFAKLKDKMKGRKNDGTISDTSSAIIPSTRNPLASTHAPSVDMQVKPQPKKSFLLGPQRLSSAHSMSDLMGPHPSKAGTSSHTHLAHCPLDSFSVEENGSGKSPHRRTLSADTAKVGMPENSSDECMSPFGLQNDPFTHPNIPTSQKFATVPRQRNPFEDDRRSWDCSQDMVSKPVEAKKKEKISLFERVTGKKDAKKSEKDPSILDSTAMYRNLTYEEVLQELVRQRELVKKKDSHIRELEDYIDDLLVRVMEETPSILRVPYEPSRRAGRFS
uniref:Rab11 family-interacting protein 2 n=1 Tax=Geotrypetes seraphini TaxID=260995 RepID=A0A6P8R8X8_GEOSA|nr:rab11 family-interacting protein 2 isoform X2 [Geotrypetes seraphini]